MTTHRLNILLAILGTIAGIFILALIHACFPAAHRSASLDRSWHRSNR